MNFKLLLMIGLVAVAPVQAAFACSVETVGCNDKPEEKAVYVRDYAANPQRKDSYAVPGSSGVWPPAVSRIVRPAKEAATTSGASEAIDSDRLSTYGSAADTRYTSSLILRKESVTDAFVREVQGALTGVPVNVRSALQRSGYHVTVAKTVPSAVPSSSGKQVRGYVHSATWNNVYGMFNRASKQVIMAEYAESEKSGGAPRMATLNDPRRRHGILKHECGHAVDQLLNNFSHSPAFANAYNLGIARLNANERKVLDYYLQAGHAGKEEAFAEIFAISCGNGCHRDTDYLFQSYFPELLGLVGQRVKGIRV